MKHLSLIGIFVGGVADIVATNILAFPIAIVAAMNSNLIAVPKEQQARALMDTMQHTPSLYIAGFLLGAICSIFGGYLAALIAKRGWIVNGALSAWACVAFGVYGMAKGVDPSSPTTHLFFFLLSPALGALGGYLRLRQQANRRSLDLAPVS